MKAGRAIWRIRVRVNASGGAERAGRRSAVARRRITLRPQISTSSGF
ncbi:hypothetical protein KCP69_03425 [Salmonella enterica subsp. enterica]|nr:hypothetical protein KCP69_03425 [Salmonella enterica subsp. enterica]